VGIASESLALFFCLWILDNRTLKCNGLFDSTVGMYHECSCEILFWIHESGSMSKPDSYHDGTMLLFVLWACTQCMRVKELLPATAAFVSR
jgi:hypothetical protein